MPRKPKEAPKPQVELVKERRKNLQNIESESTPLQIIFADAIVNIGFGPAVSRFTLGIENANKTLLPIATVVIPTNRLIEGLAAIQASIATNAEMRNNLIKGLDQIKMTIEKIEPK